MQNCPCGSLKLYSVCCGPFLNNQQLPATPEELMRSRYTAYSKKKFDYILQTMKPPALNYFNLKNARSDAKKIIWHQLEVVQAITQEEHGIVEFRAQYFYNHQKCILHEISQFIFEEGRWYYFDGQQK